MPDLRSRVLSLACLVTLSACEPVGPPPFQEGLELGGVHVTAEVLNRGRNTYNTMCRSCHGPEGDGQGPLGVHQTPPARDLRLGVIKYGSVPAGSLPTDDDLARIITRGLPGTAMLPWKVPAEELRPVIAYIKTFSPRWRRGEAPGKPVAIPPDPWGDRIAAASERGKDLFHGQAACTTCHPSAARPEPITTSSVYGPIVVPNLATARLRNGEAPDDLFRVIAAGVGGTAMPAWKGMVPDEDLWALVHYVRSLRNLPPPALGDGS